MNTLAEAAENGKSTQPKDDRISVRWKYCTRVRVENPTQRAILTVIGENCDGDQLDSYISKLTVAKRIGASRTSVYRAVKRLEELGALVAEDAGSTTHWMLPELAEIRAFARHIREEDQAAKRAKQVAKQRPTIPEEMQSEETSPVQSEQSLVQSEQSLVQSETMTFQSGTQSGVLSGETSGILSGDGKAGDSASPPDLPEDPSSFHEPLEDLKAKTKPKPKAGTVLVPEIMPELSVGDEEAAQHQHFDVTSPAPDLATHKTRQVGKILTAKEKREAVIEEAQDAAVRQWQKAEEQAKARRTA